MLENSVHLKKMQIFLLHFNYQAMETAEMYDRIHLRTTYYNYAKYLEAKGELTEAIPK